jgi:hypothetical protein
MIQANPSHKRIVVNIISKSFDDNKSINWIIKQDKKREERIKALAEYSFDICIQFGAVYLSEDKNGCVLLLFPEKKKTNLRTILLDAKLAFNAIGIERALKILNRESKVKHFHPKEPFLYLWFIGVDPKHQGKGCGSRLLEEVIDKYKYQIYLETSTIRNLPWYQKFGFEIYNELNDFGYKFFMLKKV